jgi:hypothetical protein
LLTVFIRLQDKVPKWGGKVQSLPP